MPYGYMSNSEIVQEMWRGSGRALWVCWLGFSLVGSILHLEDSPDSGTFKRRIPVDTARTAEVYHWKYLDTLMRDLCQQTNTAARKSYSWKRIGFIFFLTDHGYKKEHINITEITQATWSSS